MTLDVVVVGGGPWSPDTNFPTHHTARILSRQHRVLYLCRDSHSSLLGHLAGRLPGFHTWQDLASKVISPAPVLHVDDNLWVSSLSGLSALLPLSYPPVARRASVRLVAHQLRSLLRELKFSDPLLWFYWWFFPELVRAIPHSFAVYDIYDDHSEYDYVRSNLRRKAYSIHKERELVEEVDLVFAVSRRLVDTKARGSPVHYLPNGADITAAKAALSSAVPREMSSMPRPIIGYLGSYDSRMDWPLVESLAIARPSWSFVFVGGGTTGPARSHSNLHLLGNRSYSEALQYVNAFDAALIPFVRDRLTEAICPAKLFDYLALGKPTISTPLPAVIDIAGEDELVYIGENAEDFLRLIERALSEPPDLAGRRRGLAESLTWERRVECAMNLIEAGMSAG